MSLLYVLGSRPAMWLAQSRIAGHSPTLYQTGLPATRRLELVSARPLRNGAVAMHYRRAR